MATTANLNDATATEKDQRYRLAVAQGGLGEDIGAMAKVAPSDVPEEDDEEADVEKRFSNPFSNCLRVCYHTFFPDRTALLMIVAIVLVVCFLIFSRASEGTQPVFAFYGVYIGFSVGILLFWLIVRVLWVYLINPWLLMTTSTFVAALTAVLDPALIYVAFSVSLVLFWDKAIIETSEDAPSATMLMNSLTANETTTTVKLSILGFEGLTLKAGSNDIPVLRATEIFLILWAARNLILSVMMFYFLMGFLMNTNSGVVKYLTLYSLVRRLNASWIRLTPMREDLQAATTEVSDFAGDEFPPFPSYPASPGGGGFRRVGSSISGSKDVMWQCERRTSFQRASSVTCDVSENENQLKRLPSITNSQQVEELLSAEAAAKEKRMARAMPSSDLEHTLNRMKTLRLMGPRTQKKRALKDRYQVEYTGRGLPSFLLRRNILKTKTSGIQNLLAVEYIRQNPATLIIGGVCVEINAKRVARLAGKQMFDELIEFRNTMAPYEEDLTAAELDQRVKQTVIQTLETQLTKQGTGRTQNLSTITSRELQGGGHKPHTQSPIPSPTEVPSPVPPTRQSLALNSSLAATTPGVAAVVPPLSTVNKEKAEAPLINPIPYQINVSGPDSPGNTPDVAQPRPAAPQQQHDPVTKAEPPSDGTSTSPDGPAVIFRRDARAPTMDPRAFLTRELFELFVGDQIDEFMKYLDSGGRDQVSKKQFVNMVIKMYEARKQLLALIESQAGIRAVFRRMVAIFLTFIAMLIFLVVLGVSANTIVISGAASISSITVALSFLYSNFIQSVLFVCFLNPYDVGDRIRLDNYNLYTVAKISTYFTEMWDVHGKLTFWNHSVLYSMLIINESRCKHAGLELPIMIAYDTPPSKYEALHRLTEEYVQTTPEFIKDSFFCIMNEVVVGHYLKFTYWITCVDSWHLWQSIWTTRGKLIQMIVRQCKTLGIHYRLPIQPCAVSGVHPFDPQGPWLGEQKEHHHRHQHDHSSGAASSHSQSSVVRYRGR